MTIYEPSDDSYLLAEQVRKYARGVVLDLGTGSGIQAIEAAKKKDVKKVIASDVQKDVIDHLKNKNKNKKITFRQSNLFSNVKNIKFDTIIFNPPYLPSDLKVKDITIEGGKKGYEVIERFLSKANNYLKKEGIILMVFSSLTNPRMINSLIKKNKLKYRLLCKKHVFFEDLMVYLIQK
ncbi:MAG: methyltransferase [Candidatus Woesearchaeota archaeon]|nr:methyltransferase [Candidatus Woesearchaeota archaeon]